jgi:hypothetical protein
MVMSIHLGQTLVYQRRIATNLMAASILSRPLYDAHLSCSFLWCSAQSLR